MAKYYYGVPAKNDLPVRVLSRDRGKKPEKLAHHVRHSPDGFSWGRGDSAELARCLLLDVFGVASCPDYPNQCACSTDWVEPVYQTFGIERLGRLDANEEWKLYRDDLADWVFDAIDGLAGGIELEPEVELV